MTDRIRSIVAERIRYQPEGPRPLVREIEPAEPFPLAALGPLRSAVEAVQAHTQAPGAVCAQAVLGAVSLVTQAHADVVLPSGQTRPTSLFLLTIAASGERKSAADALALKAIYEREAELLRAYDLEMKAFKVAFDLWEARRAKAKADIKSSKREGGMPGIAAGTDLKAIGPQPKPPLAPVLVCPEPTFEGYCKLTAAGHPALGLFAAEGGIFIGGFGMSKDQKLKTASGLSSLWDGDPIKRVRAGDGSLVLAGRRLALHLMAQPHVAARLIDDPLLRDQGLLSRLLAVAPASTAGTRFFAEPDPAAQQELNRYQDCLARLVRLPLPLRDGTRNELAPRKVRLTDKARELWIELHDDVERRLGTHGEFSAISGLANKAAEHAARLAATLTLYQDPAAGMIGADAMANAVLLIQHYLTESLRLRSIAATHGILRLAQRVLDWIEQKWPEPAIHPAALYNLCTIRDVRDRRMALRILTVLEEHGYLRRLDERVEIGGALRNEAWLIHGRRLP